ncbi:hypothetical protein, conserved [Plasmodium gonderi]|uniref:Uncharacterized protein n=1 Tax=Plasmodium gonderi TaxID=77519 RepID=A0A1Y1JHS6_PLAGO|nr:hypothetical protein, conserved [Plasmodium gonderi]GAW79993.1 hypothetical protein, conserved [Plasmodium gonderi]
MNYMKMLRIASSHKGRSNVAIDMLVMEKHSGKGGERVITGKETAHGRKKSFHLDYRMNMQNCKTDNDGDDAVTIEIYNKIIDEHNLVRGRKTSSGIRKKRKKNFELVTSGSNTVPNEQKELQIRHDENENCKNEMNHGNVLSLVRKEPLWKKLNESKLSGGEFVTSGNLYKKEQLCEKKQYDMVSCKVNHSVAIEEKKKDISIKCTLEKNVNNMLQRQKENKVNLDEKKKNDHFFKIFFSSKKVKIIKSQNHPIFIHLYKLATDGKYREKQEKILLTSKKIILEREKNHITRIYTNSIDNLKEFRSYDNFILLSNKLLKKLSFLYSFKNGVLAEVAHTFHYDDVGLPHLAFCFYNINVDDSHMEVGSRHKNDYSDELEQHTHKDVSLSCTQNRRYKQTSVHMHKSDLQFLCNGDIGTIIRSCFLLKWQCIFNINDLNHMKKWGKSEGKRDEKKEVSSNKRDTTTNGKNVPTHNHVTNPKKIDINSIYNIDFFHPLTIRASGGYVLDIPYKNIQLADLHKYARENKILLLKYSSDSDLCIHYEKKCLEQDKPFLNLLNKAKGIFLILDNCNNIEKKYKSIHSNFVHIGPSNNILNNSTDENTFDHIYYVNLKNNRERPLDMISAYTIFMYILKANFFRHIPQSSYVCIT